jgi:hypothetical protein
MASNQNQDLPSASSSNNSATGRIAMNVLGTLLGAPGEASASEFPSDEDTSQQTKKSIPGKIISEWDKLNKYDLLTREYAREFVTGIGEKTFEIIKGMAIGSWKVVEPFGKLHTVYNLDDSEMSLAMLRNPDATLKNEVDAEFHKIQQGIKFVYKNPRFVTSEVMGAIVSNINNYWDDLSFKIDNRDYHGFSRQLGRGVPEAFALKATFKSLWGFGGTAMELAELSTTRLSLGITEGISEIYGLSPAYRNMFMSFRGVSLPGEGLATININPNVLNRLSLAAGDFADYAPSASMSRTSILTQYESRAGMAGGAGGTGRTRIITGSSSSPNVGRYLSQVSEGRANSAQLERFVREIQPETVKSIFNRDGTLTASAIRDAQFLQRVADYNKNAPVYVELSRRGNISDWQKFRTDKFFTTNPSSNIAKSNLNQTADAHFYKNIVTGEVYYDIDFKVKYDIANNPYISVKDFLKNLPIEWRLNGP